MSASTVDIGTMIVSTPDTCGGSARIAGTRITVRLIVELDRSGLTPEEMVCRWTHLGVGQVHAALAYYHVNRDALDREFAREEREELKLEMSLHARPRARTKK